VSLTEVILKEYKRWLLKHSPLLILEPSTEFPFQKTAPKATDPISYNVEGEPDRFEALQRP